MNTIKAADKVKDYSTFTCKACGQKGHISLACKKLKSHETEIKAAIGFDGDHAWFKKPENAKKCQDLIKSRSWFVATAATAPPWKEPALVSKTHEVESRPPAYKDH